MPKELTAKDVEKTFDDTPAPLPSFYITPYADPNPGQSDDYSLVYCPTSGCDINIAFFTPSDNHTTGTFGNTADDTFLCHQRDSVAIQQFIRDKSAAGLRILVSYIDAPSIHWSAVNRENFVRNTEGELINGRVYTNRLMESYIPVGRMWDAETPDAAAMASIMKACFLRGLQRDPDHYVFVYTTYDVRQIDEIILSTPIDPSKDEIDKALFDLGFTQISDFITKRGSLSFLETMSYGGTAAQRFEEADAYAVQFLAKGDATKLTEMRKFISIGVAPGLTSRDDAKSIAAACDYTQGGYGRFMVWAGNCPDGMALYQLMLEQEKKPLPAPLSEPKMAVTKTPASHQTSGNQYHFFQAWQKAHPRPSAKQEEESLSSFLYRCTFGMLNTEESS